MTNLQTIQSLYEAAAARDRDRLLEIFDPEIEWVQNEGFPGGGTHRGVEAVFDEVFTKLRQRWEGWRAGVDRYLDAGDAIIALGSYRGTYKETGKPMAAAFAHVYWLRDGRIMRFEQYTDTLMVARAMEAGGGAAS